MQGKASIQAYALLFEVSMSGGELATAYSAAGPLVPLLGRWEL